MFANIQKTNILFAFLDSCSLWFHPLSRDTMLMKSVNNDYIQIYIPVIVSSLYQYYNLYCLNSKHKIQYLIEVFFR